MTACIRAFVARFFLNYFAGVKTLGVW
jgi:hypothetical protein